LTDSAAANRPMTGLEWSLLLGLSVLWGGSFFFVGVAVKELPPLTIVVCRVTLAAVALQIVVRVLGVKIPGDKRVWGAFVGMGLLNNVVPFTLIVWGQTHVASGVASILNATTPLFAVVVAHFLTSDEKMTGRRLAGVAIGFAGVAVMIGAEVLQSLGTNAIAQGACLGAAISYAFAGVFGRHFKEMGIAPMATATGQVTVSSIMLFPVMLIVDQPWTMAVPSAAAIAALLGLAFLSTAVAYVLYFRILASAGATNVMLVTFLMPVSAVLLGILVLGEAILTRHFVGMALIGVGLAAIDGRLWRVLCEKAAFQSQRHP
jgi:drug/metabolite transporter (DMT)-like permease